MRIILASPRGFCAGVNMAIGSLERALELFGAPLYVYHEIVHNQRVVDSFRRRGVTFVEDLDAVPEGSYLVYSAHGVSPEVRRQSERRRLHAIDATCPIVQKVHLEAARFARQGYSIVLIGHAGHDEVVGTLGTAPEHLQLVETVEDVDRLELPDRNRVAYLTQTTLSVDDAAKIVERLRQRFPGIVGPAKKDICYATQNRQEAVKILVRQADLVLVLGSRNSSNSNRLAEIARAHHRPAYLIDGASEIDPAWFEGHEAVLVTAGASAPKEVVDECVAHLCQRFGARVDEQTVRVEHARFGLPRELRQKQDPTFVPLPAVVPLGPTSPSPPVPLAR
jgi:4-hydroxy-3-methylbut-2-enyl diphosphate reductase